VLGLDIADLKLECIFQSAGRLVRGAGSLDVTNLSCSTYTRSRKGEWSAQEGEADTEAIVVVGCVPMVLCYVCAWYCVVWYCM